MKPSYVFSEITKNYDDRNWWRHQLMTHIVGRMFRMTRETGDNYLERDWDNLLILDAARADLFEETVDLDYFDEYKQTRSPGASSAEWMRECFAGTEYPDTVYVSANPWVSRIGSDSFHEVHNLWVDEYGLDEQAHAEKNILKDHDPKNLGTVTAQMLNEKLEEVYKQNPNKRFIVHYFQPHAPCIGNPDGSVKENIDHDVGPGSKLKAGKTTREEVWSAYKDNLLYALHHAKEAAEMLGGKSVFTADHGELMGEWLWPFPIRGYAHPTGVYHPKLIEVPWATKSYGARREVHSGDIQEHEYEESEIEQRLKDLGYK